MFYKKLKAGAPTYHEIIDWNKEEVTFPPLLQTESTARKRLRSRCDWMIFRVIAKELNELFLLLHKQLIHRLATKEDQDNYKSYEVQDDPTSF